MTGVTVTPEIMLILETQLLRSKYVRNIINKRVGKFTGVTVTPETMLILDTQLLPRM